MKKTTKRKFMVCILGAAMLLSTIPVAYAAGSPIHTEELPVYKALYKCSFDVELDNSFKGSWLYDLSNSGELHITLTRTNLFPYYGNVIAEFSGRKTRTLLDFGQHMSGVGSYQFVPEYGSIEDGMFVRYSSNDEFTLQIELKKKNNQPEILLYLHDGSSKNGVYDKESNVISVKSEILDEEGDASRLFKIIGEEKENKEDSKAEDKSKADGVKKDKTEDETPVDYGPLSVDPRRWDDKKKSLEAYRKYKGDDGELYSVSFLKGTCEDEIYDYKINIHANFSIEGLNDDFSRELTDNGTLKFDYYNIQRTINGKEHWDIQLCKISGSRQEKWYESGNVNIWNPKNETPILSEDNKIVMELIPVEFTDSSLVGDAVAIENIVGASSEGSLDFVFDSAAKTCMTDIQLNLNGINKIVKLDDIDYTGGFIGYFLNMAYPTEWKEIAKGLGLNVED